MTTRRPQAIRQPRISRQMDSHIMLGNHPQTDWLRALVWGALIGWCLCVLVVLGYVLWLGLSTLWRGLGA